jgi:integrase
MGPEADYHYRMSKLKPVTLHLDEDTLRRLKALAESRSTDYLTLAGEFVTQHLAGHASIQLTLDRYSHWMPSMGRNTVDGMDEALS